MLAVTVCSSIACRLARVHVPCVYVAIPLLTVNGVVIHITVINYVALILVCVRKLSLSLVLTMHARAE
jgi:hypothetical protein